MSSPEAPGMSSPEAPAPTRPSVFGRFFWKDPNTQFLLLAAAVGVAGAFGAIGFRALSVRLTKLLFDAEDIVAGGESLPPLLRIFVPAGVAGAYNTPIAATLFVLEVVVGSFSMALFGPAVVSAVISTVLVRFLLGDEPVYQVAPFRLESILEFLPFAAIGLTSGIASALFVRSLKAAKNLFASLKLSLPISMAAGGAVVGLIGVVRPEVWGNGFGGTDRILRGNPSLPLLGALFVGKIVATSATIGSGGVGGVFTPALMVGATLGGMIAKLAQLGFPWIESPVGGYALLGMGGLLAGVTRAPLPAIIMIFELTQNTAVLPTTVV